MNSIACACAALFVNKSSKHNAIIRFNWQNQLFCTFQILLLNILIDIMQCPNFTKIETHMSPWIWTYRQHSSFAKCCAATATDVAVAVVTIALLIDREQASKASQEQILSLYWVCAYLSVCAETSDIAPCGTSCTRGLRMFYCGGITCIALRMQCNAQQCWVSIMPRYTKSENTTVLRITIV